MADPTPIVDQQPDTDGGANFLARKQYESDATLAAAYLNAHPDRAAAYGLQAPAATPSYVPGSVTPGVSPPDLSILTPEQKNQRKAVDLQAGNEAAQTSADAAQHIQNLETATKIAEGVQKAAAIGGNATALAMGGAGAIPAVLGGALATKAQDMGGQLGRDAVAKMLGPNHPMTETAGSLIGSILTGLATPGMGVASAPSTPAAGATVQHELGTILDAQGNPIPATETAPVASVAAEPAPVAPEQPTTGEVAPPPSAPAAAASAGELAPAQAATEYATPQTAFASLAQRQLEALKTARVGATTAQEMGVPEAATTVPEMQTLAEAQNLRAAVEAKIGTGEVKPPTIAAETAATAQFYTNEARAVRSMAAQIAQDKAAGIDTTVAQQDLINRFSASAIRYANLAGMRSDVGRSLQILDPLKPDNLLAAETFKLAQDFTGNSVDADLLTDKLQRLTPEQQLMMARTMGEFTASGRSVSGMVKEFFYNSLLSKFPRIIIKKGIGDASAWSFGAIDRAVAARIPSWGEGAPIVPGEASAYVRGGIEAQGDALAAAKLTWDNNASATALLGGAKGDIEPGMINAIGQNEIRGSGDGSMMSNAADLIGSIVNTPSRAIMAEHDYSYMVNFRSVLRGMAQRTASAETSAKGLTGQDAADFFEQRYADLASDPIPELMQAAHAGAQYNTFTQPLGEFGKAVVNVLDKLDKIAPGVGRLMFPFRLIPANLTKFAMARTPVAAITPTFINAIQQGGAEGQLALARLGMGVTLMGIGVMAHQQGLLTDGGSSNPQEFHGQKQTGFKPYALFDGETYAPIGQLEPLAMPLSMAADWHAIMSEMPASNEPGAGAYARKLGEAATAYAMAVGRNVTRQSYVQTFANLNALLDDLRSGGKLPDALAKFGGQELSALIPAALRGEAVREDPVMRDTRGFWDTLLSGIPGYSKTLPARVDLLDAKPIPVPGGFIANEVSPIPFGAASHDPIYAEMLRVNATPQRVPDLLPGSGSKSPGFFTSDSDPNVGVPMNKQQAYRWQVLRATVTDDEGRNLRQNLTGLIADPEYKDLADEDKAKQIDKTVLQFGAEATRQILQEDKGLAQQLDQRRKFKALGHLPQGKDPVEFLQENGIDPVSGAAQ